MSVEMPIVVVDSRPPQVVMAAASRPLTEYEIIWEHTAAWSVLREEGRGSESQRAGLGLDAALAAESGLVQLSLFLSFSSPV